MTHSALALSAALLVAPGLALAAEATHAYPRLPGDAANAQVEYALDAPGNVVGGGAAVFVGVDDGRPLFAYLAPRAQTLPPGLLPVLVNVNGETRTIYAGARRG